MRGQISLEFTILLLAIIVLSTVILSNFLKENVGSFDFNIVKIDNKAKEAINLLNSGYPYQLNTTLLYIGMKWEKINDSFINITLGVSPDINDSIKNFIINYIYNETGVNRSVYRLNLIEVE
ncbi:Protein of unknown function DUF361 [Methanocaldococcus infernus ME]|uniref:Class III signal peptide-containing protein n=1 Tax=Methanocaldococcus infernus (strain DSM 11812 / JCM 15783 / ME) TaxID=573063 RepID=D5VR11_METIM|nr:class III signal peptide-containing protein [Methanocaldococcus infernus]ADG13014.1 Protein of unknown function DUF361 [Methanocaldococcus infernus ME]